MALTYALSGLAAASDRLAIRSNNIANVLTPSYEPVEVAQEAGPYGPQVSPRLPSRDGAAAYASPLSPDTDFSTFETPSGVQLEREIVDMTMAKHAYKASALVVRTAGEMEDALLDTLV